MPGVGSEDELGVCERASALEGAWKERGLAGERADDFSGPEIVSAGPTDVGCYLQTRVTVQGLHDVGYKD